MKFAASLLAVLVLFALTSTAFGQIAVKTYNVSAGESVVLPLREFGRQKVVVVNSNFATVGAVNADPSDGDGVQPFGENATVVAKAVFDDIGEHFWLLVGLKTRITSPINGKVREFYFTGD